MTRRWSSRSLGSRFQHGVFYWLIRFTGLTGAYVLLFFVVTWYAMCPSVRERSRAYRQRCFPKAGPLAQLLHLWKLQWHFGLSLVDRAAAGITGRFVFDDTAKDKLKTLAGENKGLILLSAHTGCWQMSPYVLAEHSGLPVTILGHRHEEDIDKQAFEHAGTKAPYTMVGPEQGPLGPVTLIKILRQGELLCMMGDRSFGQTEPVVTVPFFGADITVPYLAYRLASASGSPIVFSFALRTGPLQGRLCLENVIRVPQGLGSDAGHYRSYALQYAAALEAFTMKHPYQFFNFFNLWE